MSGPPKKTGLSLYADLLDPAKKGQSGSTISSAPVKYELKQTATDTSGPALKKQDGRVPVR